MPTNTAALRTERQRIYKEVAAWDPCQLLALAHHLIESGTPRFVAYELILNYKSMLESITQSQVERLGEGIANWGDIDAFSCYVAGPVWRGPH